jgi:alpha-L-fucosidase
MPKDCKQQWWKDAKYGLFIHWGLYSQLAGEWKGSKTAGIGEWIMKHMQIPVEEYAEIAKEFNPVGFNAAEWVALAKEAGMKYLVITAKHHDGFAMFHSKCSGYNIVDATPFGRDPMKELAAECKKAGIRLCFYYSQTQDWHDPNGYGYGKPDEEKDFGKYINNKCLPQLTELLTQYGEIGLIWFDTPMAMDPKYSDMIYKHVKGIQPDCIVSGRIGNRVGEYMSTGDNMIPAAPYFGDWEVPATLNDTWGYKYYDNNWKDPKKVVELLVKINSRGGNYLLNVGPDGKGVIPQGSADILRRAGGWMRENGESIYATKPVPVMPYEYNWGFCTRRDHRLYLHVLRKVSSIALQNIKNQIKSVTLLKTGEPLAYEVSYSKASNRHKIVIQLPEACLDPLDTVIAMEYAEADPVYETLDDL